MNGTPSLITHDFFLDFLLETSSKQLKGHLQQKDASDAMPLDKDAEGILEIEGSTE
jgi:hypothetical protein